MQPNPNSNDISRMQSQPHPGYQFPPQYPLPITGALQQTPQLQPQAYNQLQQSQIPRRQRNQKKISSNPPGIPPPVQQRNQMPQQTQISVHQYIQANCAQDPDHQNLYKMVFPNTNIPIDNFIVQLLKKFHENNHYTNFFKQLPIPSLYERNEFEPRVYFPHISNSPSGYEFNIDTKNPNISKTFLVCYYVNYELQNMKIPNNTKLMISKFQSNQNDTFDCYQFGESGQCFYYILNATRFQYPIYINPTMENYIFIVVPCKQKPGDLIKRQFLQKKPNIPLDLHQFNVSCPCHHSSYDFDHLINLIFSHGDVICSACKKPIILDKLDVAYSDATEMISMILAANIQSKIFANADTNLVNEFIVDKDKDDSDDNGDFQLYDFQDSQEYIDTMNSMFST